MTNNAITKSRHILELPVQEKQKFLDSFDTVLSDCDGVVWMLLEGIPNAGHAINLLKDAGKIYKFISNNSMRTDEQYLKKFQETGVQNVIKEDLVYPVKAILKHINKNFPQQPCLVLGSKIFKATLRENGVNVKTVITPPDIDLEDLPKLIKPTDHVAAVIFDIHVNMTFVEMGLAQQYLQHKDCKLIVGAFDDTIPISKNFSVLGPAGIINLLAKSCHKEIHLFGKPGHILGQYLLEHFQIKQTKRVLFIGDNLDMDIKFGLNLGFQTLFVLSGAHSLEGMLAKPLESQPDYYADSMGDFLEFFNAVKDLIKMSVVTTFLNNSTLETKQNFIDSFDLVFCDCDGVIWQNFYDEIPGSSDAIRYLGSIGKQVAFVTNNSFISTKDQLNKFSSCGLDIEEHQLIHPAKTICDYLKMENFESDILCFACNVFKEHLLENGFQLVQEEEEFIRNGSLLDLHRAIYCQKPVSAVIIDVDFNLTAWKLMRAQMLLKNTQCLFIAGASDPYIPFGGNKLLGPGAFLKIVEEANGRKAKVFGKPGKELGEFLIRTFNITNPQRVLMLGDSMKSDITFGKMCGFQTLLVLTGGTKPDDLATVLRLENKPDYILEKLGDLYNLV